MVWHRLIGAFTAAASCLCLVLPTSFGQEKRGKKHALVVGVTEYDSKNFTHLKYTENDAEKLAAALQRSGFDGVRVLTARRGAKEGNDAPTAANIRAAVKELLAGKKRHDTVLIALAGHGLQLEVKDPEEKGEPRHFTYFCPSDASLLGVSYRTGASKQLIPLDEVFDGLGKCDAGHKLILVDACRSEMAVKGQSRRIDLNRVTIPDGVGALFSCGRGQSAYETAELGGGHGVFFYYVLEGLKGKARNDEDEVTWYSLADYVKRQVTRNVPEVIGGGAKQTPALMGNLEGESPVLVREGAEAAEPQRFTPDSLAEAVSAKREDVVYCIGDGFGAVGVARASRCKAVGFEAVPGQVRSARAAAEKAGVGALVQVKELDLGGLDLKGATLVVITLPPKKQSRLIAHLKKLPAGTRVVVAGKLAGVRGGESKTVRSEYPVTIVDYKVEARREGDKTVEVRVPVKRQEKGTALCPVTVYTTPLEFDD